MAATVAQSPELVAFRSALALTWAELDRDADAAALLDELSADDFAHLPRDQTFAAAIALLSEVVAQVGAPQHAPGLAELLRPHAGHLVLGGPAIACFGAVDRFLGMLAAASGDHERAESLYASAAALEEARGGRPGLARTRYWWGRMLSERP